MDLSCWVLGTVFDLGDGTSGLDEGYLVGYFAFATIYDSDDEDDAACDTHLLDLV